jgi:hypothetical protein
MQSQLSLAILSCQTKVDGQELSELSKMAKTNPEEYQDCITMLVDIIADIDDKEQDITKTPVLVSMDGVGMQVTHLSDEYGVRTQIDMASSNPLGIMVYQLKILSSIYDQDVGSITISRQAIDGSIESIEESIAENGYDPTVIDPVRDAQDYDRILLKIDKYLSMFMDDARN